MDLKILYKGVSNQPNSNRKAVVYQVCLHSRFLPIYCCSHRTSSLVLAKRIRLSVSHGTHLELDGYSLHLLKLTIDLSRFLGLAEIVAIECIDDGLIATISFSGATTNGVSVFDFRANQVWDGM